MDITYNEGLVSQFGTDVANAAGQLSEIHSDVAQKTGALSEFFAGQGATGFFDAQQQMLTGLDGLIQTVGQHGTTVGHVLGSAISTDHSMRNLF